MWCTLDNDGKVTGYGLNPSDLGMVEMSENDPRFVEFVNTPPVQAHEGRARKRRLIDAVLKLEDGRLTNTERDALIADRGVSPQG